MSNLLIENGLLFLLFIFLNFYSTFFWKKALPAGIYTYLMFPGVVLHEIFHTVGCLLTGAKIKKVKLFSKKGGFVKHKKPKLPLIGQVIISLAPLFGGVLFLQLFLFSLNFELSAFSLDYIFSKINQTFIENYKNWQFWVFLYFTISIIINVIPSRKDLKNSFKGLLVLFFIVLFLIYFGLFTNLILASLKVLKGLLSAGLLFSIISLGLGLLSSFISLLVQKIID